MRARLSPRPGGQGTRGHLPAEACGGGPASLTVARDLAVIGYQVTVLDCGAAPGGMMRSQIPKFRLPDSVIDEECGYILDLGVEAHFNHWVDSLRKVLDEGWDAVFVGTGAPRGRDADIPGRQEAAANIHIGIDWLANVAFGHTTKISKRVIVLGGGNTGAAGQKQTIIHHRPAQRFFILPGGQQCIQSSLLAGQPEQ
ncbi:MAG: NAD(P)-binding protein, partial [Sulfuritalea sp.]|nr:NAD(P)-binding protein [Sulfuritalea sp.]